MKRYILDTNILLDIFVFQDTKALNLKQVIIDRKIEVFACQKTIAEFADVISRPLFGLEPQQQTEILKQLQSLSQFYEDSCLPPAPWSCPDADDQIFLDLAFALKPAILISKDNHLLRLASRAAKENILITENYDIFKIEA